MCYITNFLNPAGVVERFKFPWYGMFMFGKERIICSLFNVARNTANANILQEPRYPP